MFFTNLTNPTNLMMSMMNTYETIHIDIPLVQCTRSNSPSALLKISFRNPPRQFLFYQKYQCSRSSTQTRNSMNTYWGMEKVLELGTTIKELCILSSTKWIRVCIQREYRFNTPPSYSPVYPYGHRVPVSEFDKTHTSKRPGMGAVIWMDGYASPPTFCMMWRKILGEP
jgi:hypothetical protein